MFESTSSNIRHRQWQHVNFTTVFIAAFACLVPLISATSASLESTDGPVSGPVPVLLGIQGARTNVHPIDRYNKLPQRNSKRADDTLNVKLTNLFSYYSISLYMGTPQQNVSFTIDTGSSDLWAMGSDNSYCSNAHSSVDSGLRIDCSEASTFDYEKSSTFKVNSSDTAIDFYISYGDGTFAEGLWGTDVVKIGDISLKNTSIAVATQTNSTTNVFGIGLIENEATENQVIYPSITTAFPSTPTSDSQAQDLKTYDYANLPLQMYQSGVIGAYAYSLWLNDLSASTGSILFGGVDHAKYEGTLTTVPVIGSSTFTVELSSLKLTNGKGKTVTISSEATEALLDSGTTLTYLSEAVTSSLVDALDYKFEDSLQTYYGLCSVASNSDAALLYDFSGAQISVNLSELIYPLTSSGGEQLQDNKGNDLCELLVQPSDQTILGDTFLRSAYVVYDLQNLEISLANTKYNATDSDIEAIGSSVPSATAATATSAITNTSNGASGGISIAFGPDAITAVVSGTSAPSASTTTSSGGSSSSGGSQKNSGDKSLPGASISMLSFIICIAAISFT